MFAISGRSVVFGGQRHRNHQGRQRSHMLDFLGVVGAISMHRGILSGGVLDPRLSEIV